MPPLSRIKDSYLTLLMTDGLFGSFEDLPTLEFSGKDSDECEGFIFAVQRTAFAQGKQRDDAWITDFVASCLTKDALRWWIKLDLETQRNWDLLRRAMDIEYQPSFQGGSGEEAEKFVQMVHRRARDAGKQGDDRWIMGLVPTCLSGEALRCIVPTPAAAVPVAPLPSSERAALAAEYKSKGNAAHQKRDYTSAIDLYSNAIAVAAVPEAVFYSNRAA
ncbi:TOM (translocase of outer membrane) complex component, partial [Tulasnella sp. 417]